MIYDIYYNYFKNIYKTDMADQNYIIQLSDGQQLSIPQKMSNIIQLLTIL